MKEYNSIAKKYFGSETRDVQTIMEDVDMLFVNSHPVLGSIRPTVPAVVYMGSMHIKKPKPLPQVIF